MVRATCCHPVGKNCGTLWFDSGCPPCLISAALVHVADLRGSITLASAPTVQSPIFFRHIGGSVTTHGEDSLYGEVLAELVGVDRLPAQDLLNRVARLVLTIARGFLVWSHGESVSLRSILRPGEPYASRA